ncbi:MAG TPA: hypothetical protein VG106_12135, partial [Vicinamibacterales bacterium]|nr:hypothetical protein [Vicinamibacterales bacterium]
MPRLLGLTLLSLACRSLFDGDRGEAPLHRRWFTALPRPYGWPGLPAVHDGAVIVGMVGGMAAFDAETGAHRWTA